MPPYRPPHRRSGSPPHRRSGSPSYDLSSEQSSAAAASDFRTAQDKKVFQSLADRLVPGLQVAVEGLSTAAQKLPKEERDKLFDAVAPVYKDKDGVTDKQRKAWVLAKDRYGKDVYGKELTVGTPGLLPLQPRRTGTKVKQAKSRLSTPFLPEQVFPLCVEEVDWEEWKSSYARPLAQELDCDISYVSLYRTEKGGAPVAVSVYVARVNGLKSQTEPENNYNIEIFFWAREAVEIGVVVLTLTGKALAVRMGDDRTVADLKHYLHTVGGLTARPERMSILLRGAKLDDSASLRSCGVENGCELNLLIHAGTEEEPEQ